MNLLGDLVGPCQIDCPEKCDVPEGCVLHPVPRPRHKWDDVLVCPNEGCGRAFLSVPPSACTCPCHEDSEIIHAFPCCARPPAEAK